MEDTVPTSRPQDVLERIMRAAVEWDAGLTELYAADAVHEWPFPLPGRSPRLVGREQIRAWRERAPSGASPIRFDRYDEVVVHETLDPEVIIAEYDIHGTVTSTAEPFSYPSILVLQVRDGSIVRLRDYLDPSAVARLTRALATADGPPVEPPPGHADLLTRPLFARVATIRPDGAPQNSVMWFDWTGTHLRLAHARQGQKFRNIASEPRVSVSLADPDNPYRSLEVRGVVDATDQDDNAAFFADLARRYGAPVPVLDAPHERVVLSVRPNAFATSGPADHRDAG